MTGNGFPDFEPPRFGVQQPTTEPSRPPPVVPVPPARRRSRGLWVVLIALGVVLALLIVADRLTPRIVGDRIAGTLQTALGTDQRPIVRLGGFPFLTQVLTAHYQKITITARDVPVAGSGRRLSIARLDGTLDDVRPDLSFRKITVGRFTGSATISYATLSQFVGTAVSYDSAGTNGDGYVTMSLGGAITVTGKPTLGADHDLYLARPEFRVGGRLLPGAIPNDLVNQLFRIPLPELLSGVQLSAVRADPSGLTLTASGTNITLRR